MSLRRLVCLGVLTLSAILPRTAWAASPSLPNLDITVYINKDGTFNYLETRTYAAGLGTGLQYYDLPSVPTSVDITEVAIDEDTYSYQQADSETDLQPVLFPNFDEDHQRLVFNPLDNTFDHITISYRVWGAVTRYLDVSDFDWMMYPPDSSAVDHVSIAINLPELTDPTELRAWVHGLTRRR